MLGPLAQSVEQRTFNPWVVGSIPTGPTLTLYSKKHSSISCCYITSILGLSGHLVSDTSGHFETFHKGLFKAFKEVLDEENCNFLGSQSSEGENLWFEANLPDSLTSTIPGHPSSPVVSKS